MGKLQTKKELEIKNIKPIKYRGQNFLVSKTVLKKIISAAEIKSGETVLEVGAGTGNLTEKLLTVAGQVIAIEKDKNLIALLNDKFQPRRSDIIVGGRGSDPKASEKLKIIEGDILKFDEKTIKKPYKIVANIPYYLTGKLIQKFLLSDNSPEEMILMIQKEVAERLTARPPRANYFSSLAQTFGEIKKLFGVKKENFWPKPKVDSAVVKIIPNKDSGINNPENFMEFLRTVFRQPRQTLYNNLRKSGKYQTEKIKNALATFGLPENIRPQNLDAQTIKKLFVQILNPNI